MEAPMKKHGLLVLLLIGTVACRQDQSTATTATAGPSGGSGSGYTVQCSGWFPDWISKNPPPAGTNSFQLSQGYPLGAPVIATVNGHSVITGWDPLAPIVNNSTGAAPWLDFDFATQPAAYLNAMKDYALQELPNIDFVPQNSLIVTWFHVPMMTTNLATRREPYRGVTKERALHPSEHTWVKSDLESFAVGFYNSQGGYTIGRVFNSPNPQLSDPAAAKFIAGSFVFKLIFAEYDQSKIDSTLDPLVDAPEWQVQDVAAPAAALKKVRLLQVDVAAKDHRAAQSGWVFGTLVYDKSLTTEPNHWRRLTAVGLQWGNDPAVTGSTGTLAETWINPSVPSVFKGKLGRAGRLDGPVDNPKSSCLSCHSTAQIVTGTTTQNAFRGVVLVPPASCTSAQEMTWFRNIVGGTPFGVMDAGGAGCTLVTPAVATPPLFSLDYSLQLAVGLESALFFKNPNPCQSMATPEPPPPPPPGPGATPARRAMRAGMSRLSVDAAIMDREITDDQHRR